MTTHDQAVQHQFDPQAKAYLESAVHAAGPDLEDARRLAASVASPGAAALDAGCGAGHLAFALAAHFDRVVSVDPSPSMLETVARAAAERGLAGIETRQAGAERLPFPDASFALVATRYSAHHWLDLPAALHELRRVLAPGGHLLVIDVEGDDNPLVDTHLQAIEVLRDRSHVRDRSPSEWRALIAAAGFTLVGEARWPLRLDFAPWVARMRTPPERVAAIRTLQQGAPQEVRDALAFEADGSFTASTGRYWARG